MTKGEGTSRRGLLAASAVTALGAGGLLGYQALAQTPRPRRIPLYSATVALGAALPDGEAALGRTLVQAGQLSLLVPDSRVVQVGPDATRLLAAENAVLADAPEWTRSGKFADFSRSAMQDLHVLSFGLPSPVAGWNPQWRYTWPRDSALVAVAQSLVGQTDSALSVLRFWSRVQEPDGWFQARYRPGTAITPDARPRQLDGTGWTLWATDRVLRQLPPAQATAELRALEKLVTRGVDRILQSVNTSSGLPAATPDFWEVSERSPTLATCALLAAGLESSIRLLDDLGDKARSARVMPALRRLDRTIAAAYGRYGYSRHPGRSDPDIGAAFLLPPFRDSVDEAARDALQRIVPRLRRPAGGLAPGTRWHRDGISWTPATSTVAAAFAQSDLPNEADELIQWLGDHRTIGGSYPEKVVETGDPAAVAPLAWTAAGVLLAVQARS